MVQACLLAIIAGYADAVGFLKYDAFAGLMTGNTILLGVELSRNNPTQALFHCVIIAVFLAGVIFSRVLLRIGAKPWLPLTSTSALLVLSGFTGNPYAPLTLALAMGMQNSAANRFNGVALNTVFITGNLQKLGEGLIAWAWPPKDAPSKSDGVLIFALVWMAYAMGACFGAVVNSYVTYPLLLPAALLPFVMIRRAIRV